MTQAIFLSYASQDAEAARRICDALRWPATMQDPGFAALSNVSLEV